MGNIIWLIITVPVSALFTGIGIFAWKRKEPMWFWSGSTVSAEEIADTAAYNRANGIMWIAFSLLFWGCAILGYFRPLLGGLALFAACAAGIPGLIVAYGKIYSRYKKQ